MSDATLAPRTADNDHPILDVLADRWSPRAFVRDAPIDEAKLSSALEAARWSPSAFNAQPWRFIVTRAGSASFGRVVASLTEFNQQWASHVGALVVAVADTVRTDGAPAPTAVYDLGQAVAHLSVQAHADGLHVHQMTGFDAAQVAADFSLPTTLLPFSVIALGEVGSPELLDEPLRQRETATRQRRPLDEIVLVND